MVDAQEQFHNCLIVPVICYATDAIKVSRGYKCTLLPADCLRCTPTMLDRWSWYFFAKWGGRLATRKCPLGSCEKRKFFMTFAIRRLTSFVSVFHEVSAPHAGFFWPAADSIFFSIFFLIFYFRLGSAKMNFGEKINFFIDFLKNI